MTTIFLDWDISYRYWSSHTRDRPSGKRSVGWMKNRFGMLGHVLLAADKSVLVDYRRSGSGRVHVRLWTTQKFGPTQELVLRTFLHDDSARVYLDIVRWCRGEETNRLFDTKYANGKIGKAGPWIRWFTLR